MKRKPKSYEAAILELQQMVDKLQNNEISIDDLGKQTERAAELINYCREKLRSTEGNLQTMLGEEE